MSAKSNQQSTIKDQQSPPLFLGLDSSTQSLSAIIIDLSSGEVVYEASLSFDQAAPHYGTQNGILPNNNPLIVHSPPLMWVETLDALFAKMRADGAPLSSLLAIAGSGQQHGSVYLTAAADKALANLQGDGTLKDQLSGIFSRKTAPIWMDSSSSAECAEIRDTLGGIESTAKATGSDAFERFTGPQIRKFFKQEPAAYEQTRHICLVSSFMASVLSGRIAAIDHGDASGMNLMDISSRQWHRQALDATAPALANRLTGPVPSSQVIGSISPYFAAKYGVNPAALSVAWSGDNPCSLVGLGLIKEGMLAISLGTSDTLFGYMKKCRTDAHGEGHVFVTPTGDYMSLICFKNGSLAREQVRARYSMEWNAFNSALASTPPGNNGRLMLPWFDPEIVPRVSTPGVHRKNLDPADAAGNCRAVVEAQMLSMRLHSQWMQVRPRSIYATGGGSVNNAILQIMADVMNCSVMRIEVSKSAALGAALRAAHAWLQHTGVPKTWTGIVEPFTKPLGGSQIRPDKSAAQVYDALIPAYLSFERQSIGH